MFIKTSGDLIMWDCIMQLSIHMMGEPMSITYKYHLTTKDLFLSKCVTHQLLFCYVSEVICLCRQSAVCLQNIIGMRRMQYPSDPLRSQRTGHLSEMEKMERLRQIGRQDTVHVMVYRMMHPKPFTCWICSDITHCYLSL